MSLQLIRRGRDKGRLRPTTIWPSVAVWTLFFLLVVISGLLTSAGIELIRDGGIWLTASGLTCIQLSLKAAEGGIWLLQRWRKR